MHQDQSRRFQTADPFQEDITKLAAARGTISPTPLSFGTHLFFCLEQTEGGEGV